MDALGPSCPHFCPWRALRMREGRKWSFHGNGKYMEGPMTYRASNTATCVVRKCQESNLELTDDGRSLDCEPARGLVFKGTGLHYVTAHYGRGDGSKAEAWAYLLGEIADGTERCTAENCDTCRDLREDDQKNAAFTNSYGITLIHDTLTLDYRR